MIAKDIMETQCGPIDMLQYVKNDPTITTKPIVDQLKVMKDKAYNRLVACIYMSGASHNRSDKLIEDLDNAYVLQQDQHPHNLVQAS